VATAFLGDPNPYWKSCQGARRGPLASQAASMAAMSTSPTSRAGAARPNRPKGAQGKNREQTAGVGTTSARGGGNGLKTGGGGASWLGAGPGGGGSSPRGRGRWSPRGTHGTAAGRGRPRQQDLDSATSPRFNVREKEVRSCVPTVLTFERRSHGWNGSSGPRRTPYPPPPKTRAPGTPRSRSAVQFPRPSTRNGSTRRHGPRPRRRLGHSPRGRADGGGIQGGKWSNSRLGPRKLV